MAEWVYVENNEIKEYHDLLPSSWREHSGLNLSIDNLQWLNSIGWFRVQKVSVDMGPYDQILSYSYQIESDHVKETPVIKRVTAEEQAEIEKQNIIPLLDFMREKRNNLLKETDWTQLPDINVSFDEQTRTAWINYRQALRDVPQNVLNGTFQNWPIPPT